MHIILLRSKKAPAASKVLRPHSRSNQQEEDKKWRIDARREQVFKDPEFKAKMTAQMEALRNDEAFYTWLKMMLTPEAQVPR